MDFANMNNDPNIPALTKQTALGEAMYGGSINFGHAARLARMHYKVCGQQKKQWLCSHGHCGSTMQREGGCVEWVCCR